MHRALQKFVLFHATDHEGTCFGTCFGTHSARKMGSTRRKKKQPEVVFCLVLRFTRSGPWSGSSQSCRSGWCQGSSVPLPPQSLPTRPGVSALLFPKGVTSLWRPRSWIEPPSEYVSKLDCPMLPSDSPRKVSLLVG